MHYTFNKKETAAYSDEYNQLCPCIYCRNYQTAFSGRYPEIVKLLRDFGVHTDRPLEVIDLFWNTAKDRRYYESYYSIKGELFHDKLIVYAKDAVVTLYQPDTDAPIYKNTGMEKPYFIAAISNIALPWILNERPDV